MTEQYPYISICIPVYKQVTMVRRLLDSILLQSFTDFEVIITDDSRDQVIELLAEEYRSRLHIIYHHNEVPLGTPENWNQAIRLSKGKWIKIMHQDDWFADANALEIFYLQTLAYPDKRFFFSAFANCDIKKNRVEEVRCSDWQLFFLKYSPLHLFRKVYIGNPSCTLIRNEGKLWYDRRLKFVVDFEYYIRCFQNGYQWQYIPRRLINVGFHPHQVTQFTFLVPEVQIPENNLLIEIFGKRILNNIFVFDYYWRMYRNLSIRSIDQAKGYDNDQIPDVLKRILHFQLRFPLSFLKWGGLSKITMALAYIGYRLKLI